MHHDHSIQLTRHRVAPALAGLVGGIVGLSERVSGPVRRRQPAGTLTPLVVSFGPPLTIDALSEGSGAGRAYGCFFAGLSSGYADTRFDGGQDSVQVYLTPLGIQAILGVPGAEVADQVVALDDVVPELGERLANRLDVAPTWADRFALVEALLLRRAGSAPSPDPLAVGVWTAIERSGGRARIGELVAASGWSHRHVTATFKRRIGITPKQLAGIVRFERAAADLGRMPLADLAARHGYADQSQLTRCFVRHAGETPARHAREERSTPSTALGAG